MKVWLNRLAKGGLAIAGGYATIKSVSGLEAKQWLGSSPSKTEEKHKDYKSELLIWGNGFRTPRSDYLGLYPTFEPTRIQTFDGQQQPTIRVPVLGEGFEGGIDAKGNLLVWMSPPKPAYLEEGQTSDILATRSEVKQLASAVQQAGYCDSGLWILHKDGGVSRVQVNIIRGPDHEPLKVYFGPRPEKISGLRDIQRLAFGESHVLALAKDGTTLCYGDDSLGQCGQGEQGRSASGPYPERRLEAFTPVAGRFE